MSSVTVASQGNLTSFRELFKSSSTSIAAEKKLKTPDISEEMAQHLEDNLSLLRELCWVSDIQFTSFAPVDRLVHRIQRLLLTCWHQQEAHGQVMKETF